MARGPRAPKTVHNIHVMLNKALSDAARKGIVVRNVVALADAPSLQARKRPEIKAWDVDQLVAVPRRDRGRTGSTRRSFCGAHRDAPR
jgi:hypothetical protein